MLHRSTGLSAACATALLTRMSIGPKAASVRGSNVARPPLGSPRSQGSTNPTPPNLLDAGQGLPQPFFGTSGDGNLGAFRR